MCTDWVDKCLSESKYQICVLPSQSFARSNYRMTLRLTLLIVWLCGLVTCQDYCTSGSCLCPHSFSDDTEDHDEHNSYENVERGEHPDDYDNNWEEIQVKIIRDFKYVVEVHEIRTADGYLLTYFRIPLGKVDDPSSYTGYMKNSPSTKPPVLLQHGIICSSASWTASRNALAFELANAGYDVWIGNARGNTFSRKHVKLDPDKHSKFWDFSWHEMGYYDLPASIDYILKYTGQKQLYFAGHSMGTTMYFVMGTTRPQYMNKIKAAILMSPVMFPYHVRSPFATFVPIIHFFVDCLAKGNEILANKGSMLWVNNHICRTRKYQFACRGSYFAACGFDKDQFPKDTADNIFRFTPAGVSRKVLLHFAQIKKQSHGFRQFDYRNFINGNMWMYGAYDPPLYKVDQLTAPMYVYYAQNDWVISPKDVLFTIQTLQNVKRVFPVPLEKFNHIDFMWAKDAKFLVYDDIIRTLDSIL